GGNPHQRSNTSFETWDAVKSRSTWIYDTGLEDAMKKTLGLTWLLGAVVVNLGASESLAQGQPPADHPAVTVRGQTYTPRSILARNMGSEADRVTQFPPHKIIGNIYYVGTKMLSSFLIVTPQGHMLIDSTYERSVSVIEKS